MTRPPPWLLATNCAPPGQPRGLAYWDHKVYVGTQDGRLIALNARSGKPIWIVATTDKDDGRYIAGPPRVFDGKVIIGHGGADQAPIRGYVTAYDARTRSTVVALLHRARKSGARFRERRHEDGRADLERASGGSTVVVAPCGSRSPTMRSTDGSIWERATVSPWNRRIRSRGEGDNLFLCSVVALDADTGEYIWHYQTVPGESWDFNSSMDIELAELKLGDVRHDVILHAPKNGFFYVIDRANGKLLSAEKIGKVTWAQSVDAVTGRPVEYPNIRYETGEATIWPGSPGVHNWLAMAFNPNTGIRLYTHAGFSRRLHRQGRRCGQMDRAASRTYEHRSEFQRRSARLTRRCLETG